MTFHMIVSLGGTGEDEGDGEECRGELHFLVLSSMNESASEFSTGGSARRTVTGAFKRMWRKRRVDVSTMKTNAIDDVQTGEKDMSA